MTENCSRKGEIYYRYKVRTQTIRYAELTELIDERPKHEQLLRFKHLKEIARIGIDEAKGVRFTQR